MQILKLSRLEGLTDGIFAIAMTILVLDLHIEKGLLLSQLSQILTSDVLYKLLIYIGSFIILGTLWIAMNFQLGLIEHLNRQYLWANVFYLMVICIVPFSASLVANYPNSRACIIFFATNLLFTCLGQLLTIETAHYYKLNKSFYNSALRIAVIQRIFVAPMFYLAAIFISTWNTSIAFCILVLPIMIYIVPGKIDRLNKD